MVWLLWPAPCCFGADTEAPASIDGCARSVTSAAAAAALVRGVFHAFPSDPHITAQSNKGIAGTGKHGGGGENDQKSCFHYDSCYRKMDLRQGDFVNLS